MDKERRTFLKIIVIGSGSLLAGKVMGPLFSKRLEDPFVKLSKRLDNSVNDIKKELTDPLNKKSSSPFFKVVEDEKCLSIYDKSGEEIFQIDKGT